GRRAPEPIPDFSSATRPCLASPCLAIVLAFGRPGCRLVAAITSAASTSAAPIAAIQRRRTTHSAHLVHERLALSSLRTWGQSKRGPSLLSTIGSKVKATI